MKKWIYKNKILIGICFFLVVMVSCIILIARDDSAIALPKEIKTILEQKGINSYEVNELCDYPKSEVNVEEAIVTDDELEAYVYMQVESFAEIIPVTDREYVEQGDVIYLSYMVYHNGRLINYVQSDNMIVGTGNYDIQLEQELVGKKVRTPFWVSINPQSSDEESSYDFNITIESINYFKTYELDDEFVKTNFGLANVDEFYRKCKEDLIAEKSRYNQEKAEKELLNQIAGDSSIYVNRDEVLQYSLTFVEEYEQLADIHNMELEDYVKQVMELGDMDSFYDMCYDEAEQEIKRYIVIGAIFEEQEGGITETDIQNKCLELGVEYDEVCNDEYSKETIVYYIMKDKVLERF